MKYDVAVVGAGPAGAWAATLLARRGARVALVDATHPREKPCGGGVTGRALALIRDAGIGLRLASVCICEARFLDPRTMDAVRVPLDTRPANLVVASRRDFDGALYATAAEAGAETITSRVVHLTRDRVGFLVETADGGTLHAPVVVGADGANSLVRRRLSTSFRRDQLSIATGFFAHGVTSEAIVLEITDDPPGYIWSFPRPDHLAIGICAQATAGFTPEALRTLVRRWIDRTGIAGRARLQPYSWPIPSLAAEDFASLEIAGPGWVTVGDAAGLVDPITREGIFFALQSAAFAADAIAGATSDAAPSYAEQVQREIGVELARAARYKAGFFRPQFARLMIDALRSSDRVRGVMADLVAGIQGYRDLKWRLAKTLEVGLAWRLLTSLPMPTAVRLPSDDPLSH